jgi:hypothetical protein
MENDQAMATLENESSQTSTLSATTQSQASIFQGTQASAANRTPISLVGLAPVSLAAQTILGGTNIQVTIDQPYNGQSNGFANGQNCVTATVEFIRSGGIFLIDEPIVVEKPDEISINGNTTTTGTGSSRWCMTSNTPITAQIIVKLANFPQSQTTFNVTFIPNFSINNMTDTTAFIFGRPITFIAQIAPWMQRGLKEAKLVYVSDTSDMVFNTGLPPLTFETGLTCTTSGICSATVPENLTAMTVNTTGSFVYTFKFVDQTGNVFQQSSNGTLQLP